MNVIRGRWRDVLHAPPTRLGRRGSILLVFGVVWIIRGIGILGVLPRTPPPGLLLHERLPVPVLASLWIIPGLVAVIAALRAHPKHDAAGFGALVIPAILQVVSYGWAFLVYLVGPAGIGYPAGWQSATTWIAIVVLIITVAGWAETPERIAPPVIPNRRVGDPHD